MAGRKRRRKPNARKVGINTELVDHELMKVLAKPQRVRILAILAERAPALRKSPTRRAKTSAP